MLTAVIPAHDEAANLPGTIGSLRSQTTPPDRILVVSDNSTDDTVAVSRSLGVDVMETVDNRWRKAGALNQALATVTTELVLCLDADTRLSPTFIARAVDELADSRVGAVGGVFTGEQPQSVLEWMQYNEYSRFRTTIDLTRRVQVLTGTAAVIRMDALREIARARGSQLPGRRGDMYHRDALTEDMCLTLALKTMNWRLVSPVECSCTTELMPTWADLMRQRVRWYRGAVENLASYGWSRATARYWLQQFGLAATAVVFSGYLLLTLLVAISGQLGFDLFWAAVGGVFWLERQVSLDRPNLRQRLLAAVMVPELGYAMFLQAAFVQAVWKSVRRTESQWAHLAPTSVGRGN